VKPATLMWTVDCVLRTSSCNGLLHCAVSGDITTLSLTTVILKAVIVDVCIYTEEHQLRDKRQRIMIQKQPVSLRWYLLRLRLHVSCRCGVTPLFFHFSDTWHSKLPVWLKLYHAVCNFDRQSSKQVLCNIINKEMKWKMHANYNC